MQTYRILRERLVTALDERWEGGLGVLLGGPGMGKSTVLAQAFSESATLGRGEEWLVRCQKDWTAASLHTAIRHVLPLPIDDVSGSTAGSDNEDNANEIAQFLWSQAPKPVGLVIDDLHHLDSTGLDYLLTLQQLAPTNGHLLVASRELPFITATLMTADPRFIVDGGALLFDSTELEVFSTESGVPVDDLQGAGGWPAVLALTASAGADVADAYLYQRVLAGLSRQQQGDLAVAAILGEIEQELANEILEGSVGSLLALPLVETSPQGSLIVHELWKDPLKGLVSDERINAAVRATAEYAQRFGDVDRAVSVLFGTGLAEDARTLILEHIGDGADRIPLARIDRWLTMITSPEQALLRQVLQLLRTGLAAGRVEPEELETVAEKCVNAQQFDLAAVIAEIQFAAAWSADDVDRCLALTEELERLAEKGADQAAHAPLTQAITRARHAGDQAQVIKLLRDNRGVVGNEAQLSRYLTLELETLVSLGLPFEALERLEGLDHRLSETKIRSVTYGLTYWFSGRPDDAIRALEALLLDEGRFHGVERSWITTAELFRRWRGISTSTPLDIADDPAETLSTYSRVCEGLCRVGRLIDSGDDEGAEDAIAELAARLPPTGGFTLTAWFMGVAAWYVLRPEDRPMLDAFMTDNLFGSTNQLLQDLVVARATGETPVVQQERWPNPAQIGTILPGRWAAEFALGLPSSQRILQEEILAGLYGRGVPALEGLGNSDTSALAAAAVDVLASRPRRPASTVRAHLFGPALLDVPNHPESADWRRGRVRSLLGFLAVRGRVRREVLIDALWPELDLSAGRRNVRVTLSYLTRALEPGRGQHAPAWFIRTEQDVVELQTDGLDLDVHIFESELSQAREHRQAGLASPAIESLRSACSAYGGPFLEGLDDEWILEIRDRLQLEAAAACSHLSALLAAGGDDEAYHWAERALEIDPYSFEAHDALVGAAELRGEAERQLATARRQTFLGSLE